MLLIALAAPASPVRGYSRQALAEETEEAESAVHDAAQPVPVEAERRASFFTMQFADPQLGMLNCCGPGGVDAALNWDQELEMLKLGVEKAKQLRPEFITMHGDMQDFYAVATQNTHLKPDAEDKGGNKVGDVGAKQAKDVRAALDEAVKEGIGVKYLAGNHDLGDKPTLATLDLATDRWGPLHYSFTKGPVAFIVLNSQLFTFDCKETGVETQCEKQIEDLETFVTDLQTNSEVRGLVVYSHIPPWFSSPDEDHGWGNWRKAARQKVLKDILMKPSNKLKPSLIVCGHYHGNVRFKGEAYGAPLEVVVSSAIGAQMRWDGIEGFYTPEEAASVGSEATGAAAFFEHIIGKTADGQPNFANIPARVQANAERSGMRVFEFSETGYRHRWLFLGQIPDTAGTVAELFALPEPGPTDAAELVRWPRKETSGPASPRPPWRP